MVDDGYLNEYEYLDPYKDERYHLQDFRLHGQPNGQEEVFNRAHSSLRDVIVFFWSMEAEVENFAKYVCLSI